MSRKAKEEKSIWSDGPKSEVEYIILGNELIEWAKQDNALSIDGFPIGKMIAPPVFHAIPEKSLKFGEAYSLALGIIGSRRERLAHEGAMNAHIVKETMPLYDPVYRKWLISEKNKEENPDPFFIQFLAILWIINIATDRIITAEKTTRAIIKESSEAILEGRE
jgi:hypothetical protein